MNDVTFTRVEKTAGNTKELADVLAAMGRAAAQAAEEWQDRDALGVAIVLETTSVAIHRNKVPQLVEVMKAFLPLMGIGG
jgi:hypothetical protein